MTAAEPSTPDPSREQLRKELWDELYAAGVAFPPTGLIFVELDTAMDEVMRIVGELLARAHYMGEAANLLASNVQSLTAELEAAKSVNRNLHKLLQARDAQLAENVGDAR